MSGIPREEYIAHFRAAEHGLKKKGYKVFNPCRWQWFLRFLPYKVCLAFDVFMMAFCDAVYMLDGWAVSDGARAENQYALSTGMIVMFER